jgi:hypothetical protein
MRRIILLALITSLGLFAWDNNEDLLAASRSGDLAAVKAALEKGASIEARTTYGQTPLYIAAMSGHEPIVRFLIEKGAVIDVTDTFYKMNMVVFALQRKHYDIVKLLIAKSPANPDQKLSIVANSGRPELVQTVLDAGKPGQPALNRTYEIALQRKQTEVAELLKKAGAEAVPPATVDAKVLASYAGSFKSEQTPLEIKVFVKEGQLFAQATSQPEFPLTPRSATKFEFLAAQLEITFDTPDSFTLKQGGRDLKFTKVVPK